jgi:serine phosphatase RsbU (regulator of sigma subunit)
MRILVGWDDPQQAELLQLYLAAGDNEVFIGQSVNELQQAQNSETWDILLLSASLPDDASAKQFFSQFHEAFPECPIVGAFKSEEVYRIAHFVTGGMRSFMIRDDADDFLFLVQLILENTFDGVRAEQEKILADKLRDEIGSVYKLQQSVLPQQIPNPPGYEICARYEPAQIQVQGGKTVTLAGGDYYDCFSLPDGSLVMLVGDATGHGMKACMSIMTLHTLVRLVFKNKQHKPGAFVTELNRILCEEKMVSDHGGFITLLYGVLNPKRNVFQWASAGHPYPLLQELGSGKFSELAAGEAGNMPLGMMEDSKYKTRKHKIPANSRLLLYSDGLVEAFPDGAKEEGEFGLERVQQVLEKSAKLPLQQALESLFTSSDEYTQGAGRHDDTSIMLIEKS